MSEEDKLFNFLAGLESWAHAELRRRGVKNLQSTIVAADSLVDYKVVSNFEFEKEGNDKRGNRWKPMKDFNENHVGGSKEVIQYFVERKNGCFVCDDEH